MRCPNGAPVLRVFAGPQPDGYTWDQVASWMADDLKDCVEHGKKYGVLIGIQNHGDTLKTADDVLKIVKMVDSEWFGVIVDTGYFLSPDPYEDIARASLCRQLADQGKRRRGSRAFKDRLEAARADHPRGRLSGLSPDRDALDQRRNRSL